MPFAPFPTPDDILAAGRLSHIPLPLSGATLSGLVIQNNRVQFSGNMIIDQSSFVGGAVIQGIYSTNYGEAIKFTPTQNLTTFKITIRVKKAGTITTDLPIVIQGKNGSNLPDGITIGTATIAGGYITTSYQDFVLTYENVSLVSGTTYFLVGLVSAGDSNNYYAFDNGDDASTANAYKCVSGTWSAVSGKSFSFKIESLTSGTATFRITPAQLAQWKQLITYVKLNTNNSATYTIKDTGGSTITGPTALANGLNTIDISSLVSAELYKAVDVVVTLSRVSASDISPELHYAAVLVEGQDELAWRKKSIFTTAPTVTHYANTITNTTGAGYLTTIINGYTAAVNVSVQIDSGTIYKYTIPTGGYVVFGGYGRRFNSSLIVKADQTAVYVEGVLD